MADANILKECASRNEGAAHYDQLLFLPGLVALLPLSVDVLHVHSVVHELRY